MNIIAAVAFATSAAATAQEGAMKIWDFKGEKLEQPPSGFSFAKTGPGRPGSWVVRADPSAPGGDRVLAQVDTDDTNHRFPVAVADAPIVKDLRLEVRCKPVAGKKDQAGKIGLWTKADSVTYFAGLSVNASP